MHQIETHFPSEGYFSIVFVLWSKTAKFSEYNHRSVVSDLLFGIISQVHGPKLITNKKSIRVGSSL